MIFTPWNEQLASLDVILSLDPQVTSADDSGSSGPLLTWWWLMYERREEIASEVLKSSKRDSAASYLQLDTSSSMGIVWDGVVPMLKDVTLYSNIFYHWVTITHAQGIYIL